MKNGIAIQTRDLCRYFHTVHAVEKLNLEIPSGTIFGFLGPNGSGKTTTIRLLLGLLEPTQGSASVLGYDVLTQPDQIRHNCGALLEHHGLYERLTAEENLEFYGRVWRIPKTLRAKRIHDLLEKLSLWDRRKEIVAEWSRGMKQKLAIARTLMHQPKLIFLDEPTAGLDPQAASSLRKDLALLAEHEGITVFLTTHNLTEAELLCHLVGVLKQGILITVGSPNELKARRDHLRVEVIGSGFTDVIINELNTRPEVETINKRNGSILLDLKLESSVAPLVAYLVENGILVEEVRKEKASLEEVFLSLMEEES